MNSAEASIRSYTSWGSTPDRAARTAPARQAFGARFERQARERLGDNASDRAVSQAADALKCAHFRLMAQKSAAARQARTASP